MRGALPCNRQKSIRNGITPAYAGRTHRHKYRYSDKRDHPRVCGAHQYMQALCRLAKGSPPRMRGAPKLRLCIVLSAGITPAYAGRTDFQKHFKKWGGDHPRVCGAHSASIMPSISLSGSPPRMRGAPLSLTLVVEVQGITPAYAGRTLSYNR